MSRGTTCSSTTESKGRTVRCIKPPDHDDSHWGLGDRGMDVVWQEHLIVPPPRGEA